jgi:hypothetical protein
MTDRSNFKDYLLVLSNNLPNKNMTLEQLSYADRLQLARTKRDYYLRDMADIQSYNPVRFTAQWDSDWQAAILAAEAYITDEDVVDQSTSIAQQVDTLMAECRKLYQRFIKPFVEDAFPNNKGMQNQFGIDDYSDYNRTANKMLIFLRKLYDQCSVHQTDLTAVGINPLHIAKIQTLYNDLTQASLAQNTFMGKRMTSAQERQALFLRMDEFTHQTCRAAKNVYLDEDMAKYRCYLLPTRNTETAPQHTLPANAKMEVLQPMVETDFVEVENTGNVDFSMYIAESTQTSVPATAVVITPGQKQTYSATDLGIDVNSTQPQMLIFWNSHAMEGKYTVEKLE